MRLAIKDALHCTWQSTQGKLVAQTSCWQEDLCGPSRLMDAGLRQHPSFSVTEAAPTKVILVVEDDEANAEVLLQETSSQVYLAADGRAALQLISQITPDLFILDDRLPTMTGMELYACLHAHPRFKQTPALILTACLEDSQEAIASHKLLALAKHFHVDELLSLMAKVFDHSLASLLNNS